MNKNRNLKRSFLILGQIYLRKCEGEKIWWIFKNNMQQSRFLTIKQAKNIFSYTGF